MAIDIPTGAPNPDNFWLRGADRSRPTAALSAPTACPECESAAITTTARNPDENTYWRCSACGEVWNAFRRNTRRSGGYRWR